MKYLSRFQHHISYITIYSIFLYSLYFSLVMSIQEEPIQEYIGTYTGVYRKKSWATDNSVK